MRAHLALFAVAGCVVSMALVPSARATEPPPAASSSAAPTRVAASRGLVVVALVDGPDGATDGATDVATDAAWALARSIYADPLLHPPSFDEARARVLVGEAAARGASRAVTDLAELRAGVHGDDAASRQVLGAIAREVGVRGVVVVSPAKPPTARVFVAETGTFDAATYAPDDSTASSWSSAVSSLERAFGLVAIDRLAVAPATTAGAAPAASAPATVPGPSLAVREGPRIDPASLPASKKFYESGWFWGALGAAAFAGGAIFFVTRDNSPQTIHLQMQVPK